MYLCHATTDVTANRTHFAINKKMRPLFKQNLFTFLLSSKNCFTTLRYCDRNDCRPGLSATLDCVEKTKLEIVLLQALTTSNLLTCKHLTFFISMLPLSSQALVVLDFFLAITKLSFKTLRKTWTILSSSLMSKCSSCLLKHRLFQRPLVVLLRIFILQTLLLLSNFRQFLLPARTSRPIQAFFPYGK